MTGKVSSEEDEGHCHNKDHDSGNRSSDQSYDPSWRHIGYVIIDED